MGYYGATHSEGTACVHLHEAAVRLDSLAQELELYTSDGDSASPSVELLRQETVSMMGTTVQEVPTGATEEVCVEYTPGGDCARFELRQETEQVEQPMARRVVERDTKICVSASEVLTAGTEWIRLAATPSVGRTVRFQWLLAHVCDPSAMSCPCPRFFGSVDGECVALAASDPETRTAEAVCREWTIGHQDLEPHREAAPSCSPPPLSEAAIEATMRRINMYRWLVGTSPVPYLPGEERDHQECALMMARHGGLDHNPPPSWDCYTRGGARVAGRSNLSGNRSTPGSAVEGQIRDIGPNVATLGHRRWLLSSQLGGVRLGWAYGSACVGVFARGGRGAEWVAYPNPGFAPVATTVDAWSFQSDFPLTDVQVRVSSAGVERPVRVYRPQMPTVGRQEAVAWVLEGWSPAVGETYDVEVVTAERTIRYRVQPIDCQ